MVLGRRHLGKQKSRKGWDLHGFVLEALNACWSSMEQLMQSLQQRLRVGLGIYPAIRPPHDRADCPKYQDADHTGWRSIQLWLFRRFFELDPRPRSRLAGGISISGIVGFGVGKKEFVFTFILNCYARLSPRVCLCFDLTNCPICYHICQIKSSSQKFSTRVALV